MGIRFACHECGKRLNIKSELAGRRGVCPACSAKFRIPLSDSETSTPVDKTSPNPGDANVLAEYEPEATWYVRPPSGGQYGPASTELLRQWIGEGRIAAASLLWRDGWPQWRTASESLPELAARLPGEPLVGRAPVPSVRDVNETLRMETLAVATTTTELELAGQSTVGAQRRVRSLRRVLWIGLLSAVAIVLMGVLVAILVNRG